MFGDSELKKLNLKLPRTIQLFDMQLQEEEWFSNCWQLDNRPINRLENFRSTKQNNAFFILCVN